MNGIVKIGRHPDGRIEDFNEESLDVECSWWEGQTLVIKAYDRFECPVYIKVQAQFLMEELLGFAATIEIKQSQTLPPRPEGKG